VENPSARHLQQIKLTGNFPLNENIFGEDKFLPPPLPMSLTDRTVRQQNQPVHFQVLRTTMKKKHQLDL